MGIGKRRLVKLVNEAVREFGWVVGIRRGGKKSLRIFLRPRSDVIDLDNYQQRFKTAVQAMHAIQANVIDVLARGKSFSTRAFGIFPLIPVERSRKVGATPLRLGVLIPPTTYGKGSKVIGVDAGGVLLPLKLYELEDLALVPLIKKGYGHLIGNSIHETLASIYMHSILSPAAFARNVYVTVVYPDARDPNHTRPPYSRSPGIVKTEFDAIFIDRAGMPHIMEAKVAPRGGDVRAWKSIVVKKMQTYEKALQQLSKVGVSAYLHFVVTSQDPKMARIYAKKAAGHIQRMSSLYPTTVHGVHVSEQGIERVFIQTFEPERFR